MAGDVVVVGAGPAGSAVAALLAEAGHAVLLLDRATFPRPKPCAEYLSPGTEPLLARLGVLPDLDRGPSRRLRGMEVRTPHDRRWLITYHVDGQPRYARAAPRTHLDALLLAAARSRGVTVWQGFRVTSVLERAGAVVGIRGHDATGATFDLLARLVVGADGLQSVVARSLGTLVARRWPRRLGLVAHYQGVPWPEEHGQMHVGRRGYVGVAPVDEKLLTVGLVAPMPQGRLGPAAAALDAALADYPALAARLASGKRVGPVRGVGPMAHVVRSCGGAGYLLVGDAAGFLDPFTGEGIYRALRGAEVAADVATEALRRGSDVAIIGPDYAWARRAAFQAKERLTVAIQALLETPALMEYVVARLSSRPEVGAQLANVLGDLAPAETVLHPGYLWDLLRP